MFKALNKARTLVRDDLLGSLLLHLRFRGGRWLLRRPGAKEWEIEALFDAEAYQARYADRGTENPVAHYLAHGVHEKLNPNWLFDTSHYLDRYPDVASAKRNPLVHFIATGASERRDPHPLFQTAYYLDHNPDVASSGANPLAHYLAHGCAEGRFPNPLFDPAWYEATYRDLGDSPPLADYWQRGLPEGRNPNPLFETAYYAKRYPHVIREGFHPLQHYLLRGAYEQYNPSPLFDSSYYLAQKPEIVEAGTNPLAHYLFEGGWRFADPHPLFDTSFYLSRYPEVAAAGEVPLVDFVVRGRREGRWPNPLFDPSYYLAQYPEVAESGINPLIDYVEGGEARGRNPNPLFDSQYYRKRHTDIAKEMNALEHYLHKGAYQGADPSPKFDSGYYLEANPDVAMAGINPLAHYLWIGQEQRRSPSRPEGGEQPTISIEPVADGPLVSVLMPVFNTPRWILQAAIQSVREQSYRHWELCLVDDGSTAEETAQAIAELPTNDPRVKVQKFATNQGIASATNAAARMARGELMAMLDHDDELTPDALAAVVQEFQAHPAAEAVYTDQDITNGDGSTASTFYKPDWSPELFRGVMYVGHFLVVRSHALRQAGGFRSEFDGVQDFEFLLRVSERTQDIRHVRRAAYKWRKTSDSVSGRSPQEQEKQLTAVNAHLRRCGVPMRADAHERHPGFLRLKPLAPESAAAQYQLFWDAEQGNCPPDLVGNLALYAAMPDVGCVSPLIVRADGRVHNAGVIAGPEGTLRYAYSGWDIASRGYSGTLACTHEVSLVSGDCVLIAQARLAELGGLRDTFGERRYRVMDLAARARAAGLRNIVTTAATVRLSGVSHPVPEECHRRFVAEWERELAQPDPYGHALFDHPSHLRLPEASQTERMESSLR